MIIPYALGPKTLRRQKLSKTKKKGARAYLHEEEPQKLEFWRGSIAVRIHVKQRF